MDLLCAERLADQRTAERDPVLLGDMRVLFNLLDAESVYIPPCNYFAVVQRDIQPYMRKVVSTWMLEVCEEQQCEDQVFPLAANFLDRFLCACAISRRQLQLAAAVCLLLASKIRQCHALPVDLLCFYSDNSITPDELRKWELLVLSKLQWNMTAVTGFDYVDHVLERAQLSEAGVGLNGALVRRHAHTLVALCYTEPELIQCAPSVIATASICAAVRGLNLPSAPVAISRVQKLTRVTPSKAERVVRHIERIVASEAAVLQAQETLTSKNPPGLAQGCAAMACAAANAGYVDAMDATLPGKLASLPTAESRQPETPTDVADVHV